MILNRYERMIAKRYLLPGKGEGFIFLVATISLFAVALGVAALIIVMSVMNGFRAELFDKSVGLNGHAVIQGYDGRLSGWQEIEAARETHARRHLRPAADRAAADGVGQRPGRRRAGPRRADRRHPHQQGDERERQVGRHALADAGQRHHRHRLAARRGAGRLSRAAKSR